MASSLAPGIASGTRVPYHTTSRARLPDVTADALRSAAVRLPSDNLRQAGPWIARGHLRFSPEARAVLPLIMGGACSDVPCDVSAGSRAVILRAADSGTLRRELAASMHVDSMGFAASDRDGLHRGPRSPGRDTAGPLGGLAGIGVGATLLGTSHARDSAGPHGGLAGTGDGDGDGTPHARDSAGPHGGLAGTGDGNGDAERRARDSAGRFLPRGGGASLGPTLLGAPPDRDSAGLHGGLTGAMVVGELAADSGGDGDAAQRARDSAGRFLPRDGTGSVGRFFGGPLGGSHGAARLDPVAPPPPPSPTATVFATGGDGLLLGADAVLPSQSNIKTTLAN
jgi:hypothetical protein